jgi:hypothetical protein
VTFLDWVFSTFSSVGLIAALAWLFRIVIETRLRASVRHEFNEKLESFRADLRKSEEGFKADLRAKESQIEALRSGALSGLISRQAVLDKRRVEAIEQLWDAIEKLAPLKMPASMVACIKYEWALEKASLDPAARKFFETIANTCPPEKLQKTDAHKSRPFVSDLAWALFSAYQAILLGAVARLHILKSGLSGDLLKADHVSATTKAALPAYSSYIDKYGDAGCYQLLNVLETELLKELRRILAGEESDKASVEQASKIMLAVTKLQEQSQTMESGSGVLSKSVMKPEIPSPTPQFQQGST